MHQPADCDLGSRKSARQYGGDWDKIALGRQRGRKGFWTARPFVVDTPARVTPLAALLVHSLFVQFAQRHLRAGSESWDFDF